MHKINEFSVPMPFDAKHIELLAAINGQYKKSKITMLYNCLPMNACDSSGFEQQRVKDNRINSLMEPLLMNFYSELVKYHIQPKYDCNVMPSCVYTEKELFTIATLLSNSGPERSRLIGEKSMCRPVIDILPDLTAIRCFGMSDICKAKIADFKSVADLINFFLKEIDFRIANTLKHDECDSCYKCKTLQCAGGCLCFRKKYLKGAN